MTTPLQTKHALVTDSDPTPAEGNPPPRYLNALDNKRGFPHFNALEKRKQEDETKRYYANIGTEPPYDIRHSPSVFTTIKTLTDFRKRYFTTPGWVEDVAKYYNRGDLRIGREMHCVFGSSDSNAAPNMSRKFLARFQAEGVIIMSRKYKMEACVHRRRRPYLPWRSPPLPAALG